MTREEIWTVAGGGGYTVKPRPCVIVQDVAFEPRSPSRFAFSHPILQRLRSFESGWSLTA